MFHTNGPKEIDEFEFKIKSPRVFFLMTQKGVPWERGVSMPFVGTKLRFCSKKIQVAIEIIPCMSGAASFRPLALCAKV